MQTSKFRSPLVPAVMLFSALAALVLPACSAAMAHRAGREALVELPHSQLGAARRGNRLARLDAGSKLFIHVGLRFDDPAGAEQYANAVSSPASPLYRRFLTPQEIADRFGPTPAEYDAVISYLKSSGLTVSQMDNARLGIGASGTASRIEAAFGTTLHWYRESAADARRRAGPLAEPLTFFANSGPVHLPASLAPLVRGVFGLESYVRPRRLAHRSARRQTVAPFSPDMVRTAYDSAPLYSATASPGLDRTIGISDFDAFDLTNTSTYISTFGLPTPAAGALSNIKVVTIQGGYTGTPQSEGDLDNQMVIGMAPLANIIIYDGPETLAGLMAVLTQEISDDEIDIATESYGWDMADGFDGTTLGQAHALHLSMTMEGITYLAASGDSGTNLQPDLYPQPDPEVLDVGGTTLTLTSTNQIETEVGWDDPTDGYSSGGGYSPTSGFALPSYQVGRGVPTNVPYRLIPDVALAAGGSQTGLLANGPYDFYYGLDGITLELSAPGTSNASPTFAGSLALVEQWLIDNGYLTADSSGHYRLGRLNDAIYAQNGRNDVWHDIVSGSSQSGTEFPSGATCTPFWDYVTGWGSVDFYNLAVSLSAPLAVTVTPSYANLSVGATLPLSARVAGSAVTSVTWSLASGPGSVNASGVYSAPATASYPETAVVEAASTIDTASPVFGTSTITVVPASGNAVAGTVSLQDCVQLEQPITFAFRPASGTAFSVTTPLSSTGAFSIAGVPNGTYTIAIKGAKWLQRDLTEVVVSRAVSGLSASLSGGDLNGDNVVDLNDFAILAAAFGSSPSSPNWNSVADINCDGVVDLNDFSILASNFGASGDP
jgi:subtilase family serine protease